MEGGINGIFGIGLKVNYLYFGKYIFVIIQVFVFLIIYKLVKGLNLLGV